MVQVNVVTGFLGVGKTTFIRAVLAQKPTHERWAVLVNEFGEVGIDGAMLAGFGDQVIIREVPGGCLCCANGVPFQVALTQLIGRAQPTRLLIEPTGLGHPREILALLQQPPYQPALSIGATLTLVDARKLSDPRYTGHDIFNQQIDAADCVLAAKADTYGGDEWAQLRAYLDARGLAHIGIVSGREEAHFLACLALPSRAASASLSSKNATLLSTFLSPFLSPLLILPANFNAQGFVHRARSADGYHAYGWLFSPTLRFDALALEVLFSGALGERLKAVVKTPQSVLAFSRVDGILSVSALTESLDSRVEILSSEALNIDQLQAALLSAVISSQP